MNKIIVKVSRVIPEWPRVNVYIEESASKEDCRYILGTLVPHVEDAPKLLGAFLAGGATVEDELRVGEIQGDVTDGKP